MRAGDSGTSIELPIDEVNDALKLISKTKNEVVKGKQTHPSESEAAPITKAKAAKAPEQIPVAETIVGSESGTHVCLTEADCRAQAQLEELQMFRVVEGPKISKGCFRKGDRRSVAYWGEGTTEEISTPDLPGVQQRLYCDISVTKEVAEEDVLSSNESEDTIMSGESRDFVSSEDTEEETETEEELSITEVDYSIALDQEKFEERFDAIPQEKGHSYKSNLVISSIVVGSVVFLAFIVLFVAKAKNKLRRRRGDEDSSDRHWITSSASEITPVASNTRSNKLTRSVPTGVAQFTIDEE